ncbi:MAG: hypothetical protein B7C24_12280 [Bacteroidetes bacterium 4572_77]|nr:MAG: hypothetical protein B7C24_12280 [Bacteroidetes bacterium 4572_77]
MPGGQPAYAKGISSSRVSSYTPTRKSIQQKEQASVTTRINLDPEIDVAENKEEIKEAKASPDESFERIVENKGVSVYRIEIAVKPTAPIPLRQLQNWVANEKISEWTYKNNYRYTIGRFENEQVARAFLKYVRLQFSLPDAHLVITKGDRWLKVHR